MANYPTRIATTAACPICAGTIYTWSRTSMKVEQFKPIEQLSTSMILVSQDARVYVRRCEQCRNVQYFGEAPR
jgi:hypothetical protein